MSAVRPLEAATLLVFSLALSSFDALSGTVGTASYAAVAMLLIALGVIVTKGNSETDATPRLAPLAARSDARLTTRHGRA